MFYLLPRVDTLHRILKARISWAQLRKKRKLKLVGRVKLWGFFGFFMRVNERRGKTRFFFIYLLRLLIREDYMESEEGWRKLERLLDHLLCYNVARPHWVECEGSFEEKSRKDGNYMNLIIMIIDALWWPAHHCVEQGVRKLILFTRAEDTSLRPESK